MIMSLHGSSSFFCFFLGAEDDNKPPNLSSFVSFFLQMQKMKTSWEAFGSLSSPGFFLKCEFNGYITTWCIIIIPSYMWECHHPLANAKVRRKGAVRYTTFGQAPSQKEPHQWWWLEFLVCVGNSIYLICKWAQYNWFFFNFKEILKILELVIL
jgi:hypothetical protein